MTLQPQERPDRHRDVVTLRPTGAAPFRNSTLLQPPMIVLDRPGSLAQAQPRNTAYRQVIGRAVFSVADSRDEPYARIGP
jgi:hypothetical protein